MKSSARPARMYLLCFNILLHNTTQNNADNLRLILETINTVQMLSFGGEGS